MKRADIFVAFAVHSGRFVLLDVIVVNSALVRKVAVKLACLDTQRTKSSAMSS